MTRTSMIAVLAAFVCLLVASQDALARNRMYNPAVGRFMQRDPAGTDIAPMASRRVSESAYTERDPSQQYADGASLYQYAISSPIALTDPSGLFSGDYNLHHIVGNWYAQYSTYGCRAQGLRILLSTDFHKLLEGGLRPIWTALRNGQISQWTAYNRALIYQLRMVPAMLNNSRAAAAATGGSTLVWVGGGRAIIAQLGYQTLGQAALGATGIGTVAMGAYVVYDLSDQILDNLEFAARQQTSIDIWNERVSTGRRYGGSVASKVIGSIKDQTNCRGAGGTAVSKCFSDFTARAEAVGGPF